MHQQNSDKIDAAAILRELSCKGYAITQTDDVDSFKQLCNQIGTAKQYAEVRLIEGKKEYKWVPDAVPFHTDNPRMAYIGFYCVRPDTPHGNNLIMDVRNILSQMTGDELDMLARVQMKMPNCGELYPVYIPAERPQIFYLPYFWTKVAAEQNAETQAAMLHLHELVLTEYAKGNYLSIALKANEVLFMDNRYFLHARGELTKTSDRFLIRALIAA